MLRDRARLHEHQRRAVDTGDATRDRGKHLPPRPPGRWKRRVEARGDQLDDRSRRLARDAHARRFVPADPLRESFERMHGRTQRHAPRSRSAGAFDPRPERFEGRGQKRAAFSLREQMRFVEHYVAHGRECVARARAEHDRERLGGAHEHIGRSRVHRRTFGRARIAGARSKSQRTRRELTRPRDKLLESIRLLMHQRACRRDVEQPHAGRITRLQRERERKKRREGLSRSRRRDEEHVARVFEFVEGSSLHVGRRHPARRKVRDRTRTHRVPCAPHLVC